jgi:TPR repeat protein
MPERIMPSSVRIRIAHLVSAACLLLIGGVVPGEGPVAHAAGLHRDGSTVGRLAVRAKRGDAHAQAMLGFLYANGQGVPQSYDVAVGWYQRSARQGDSDGQYLLGLMYDKGFGVEADVVLAHKWLNLAAAHASPHNRENFLRIRDAVASKMTPAQLEAAQKLALDFIPARR